MERHDYRSVALSVLLVLSVVSTGFLGSAAGASTDRPELTASSSPATVQSPQSDHVTCHLNQSCPVPDSSVDLNASGAGVDVLIDGSHQGSTFTKFANRLSQRGYDVDTKKSTSGGLTFWNDSAADGLSDYDVVIIPVPQTAYSEAEQVAIDEYVRNGGSLFVVGDWTSPLQGNAGKLNDVTDPYGLHFNGENDDWLRNVQDPTNKTVEEYEWRVILHNRGQHPIMNNVETVEYDGVSLNVTDTANGTQAPLLYGDNDTYEYTYSTTEEEYPRGERVVGAAATWNIGDNGRVVAFGSQKSLTTYLTDEWQAEHQQTDTRPFLFRTMKWLAASGHVERPDKPVAVTGERIKGGETPANETIVLKNSEVAAAIGTETNGPFGTLPGGIYDANAYGLTTDEIGVAEFAFDDFGTWPVYESFETRNASDPNGSAVVVAEGHLKNQSEVKITTTYTLPANASHIWINTTMENGGDERLPVNDSEQLQSGAALSSEGLSTWLPGDGTLEEDRYAPVSSDTLQQPWAALTGDRVSYGVWGGNGSFTAYTASSTWVDPWLEHRLEPGETQSADFAFFVGADGVSDDHCSQCFPTKYGSARTRAYVEGNVTPDRWAQSVKDGHTYATYGPAVEFTVDEQMPGETVTATESSVEAAATVRNVDELAYAEVIRNGTVVSNVSLDGTNDTVATAVDVEGDAWVALRVVDEEGDRALTSPVWISAGQQGESDTDDGGESGGATEDATETESTAEPTEAEATEPATTTATETASASGPGFTAVVALVALVAAALLAGRSDN